MGRDMQQSFQKQMSGVAAEEQARQFIQDSKGFKPAQIKGFLPDVQESDIEEVTKEINKRFLVLRKEMLIFNPTTLTRLTTDEFNIKMGKHIAEVSIQYDKNGLEKIYKKITKVLMTIPSNDEYKEDLEIVKEIKREYIETKKMPKSSMLYLNKIYRYLTQDKENEKIEIEKETIDSLRYTADRIKEFAEREAKQQREANQHWKWRI